MMLEQEGAKGFLNEINIGDKVGIIFHDDLDGFSSGILLYDFLKKKECKDIKHHIFSFGKTSLNQLKNELSDRNKLIFVDIAPFGIVKEMEGAWIGKRCLSIDHHKREMPLPGNFIDYFSEDYVPASRMTFELIEDKKKDWLALAGVIADAGDKYPVNSEFIEDILAEHKIRDVKTFREKYVDKIEELLIYFDENLYEAFERLKILKRLEDIKNFADLIKEVDFEIKKFRTNFETDKEIIGGIIFYYLPRLKFGIKTFLINKISMDNPGEIIIFASKSDNNKITLSGRNQTKRVKTSNSSWLVN